MLNTPISSGIPAIDTACHSLLVGDNVVWRSTDHELYSTVCLAMLQVGREQRWPLVYFRFANHTAITSAADVQVYHPEPEKGFEHFISMIHRVIASHGTGGVYVFDSLSDLQEMYFSDRMIGCFFELTCPYLRRMETIAYFRLDPSAHSCYATEPIRRTTQVWLDAYTCAGERYLQPLKTWHDPEGNTLPLFHWDADTAREVQNSAIESMVRQSPGWNEMPSTSERQIDVWDTALMRFEDLQRLSQAHSTPLEQIPELQRLWNIAERMLLSTQPRMLGLIHRYITPQDIVGLWKRMIGTGQIGGKAVGMLLSRAILRKQHPHIHATLENHDSFFIGSDVFYTFLVENDCWWDRRELHASPQNESACRIVADRMKTGRFSPQIIQGFRDLLEYFGNAPIIVRSSSLLEDNFGNAFAGKYASFFLTNQESAERRLQKLLDAVREIYAGTVSPEALAYRRERGVLDQDEQMALLVQRVSGRRRKAWFFPMPQVWGFRIIRIPGMTLCRHRRE